MFFVKSFVQPRRSIEDQLFPCHSKPRPVNCPTVTRSACARIPYAEYKLMILAQLAGANALQGDSKMKLLLVRHAESEGNASGDYSTAVADSLSAQGEKQALALVEPLSSWTFQEIIVSPLQRAQQTLAPYLRSSCQTAEIWPETAEVNCHPERASAARSWQPVPMDLPETMASLFVFRENKAVRPARPETIETEMCRVTSTLKRIQERTADAQHTILMVTHGNFIRELVDHMLEPPQKNLFPVENCARILMTWNKGWAMEYHRGLKRMG